MLAGDGAAVAGGDAVRGRDAGRCEKAFVGVTSVSETASDIATGRCTAHRVSLRERGTTAMMGLAAPDFADADWDSC